MDGRRLIAEVFKEAGRLGLSRLERLALVLAVAVLIVLGRQGIAALKTLSLEPQADPEAGPPSPVVDGEGNPVALGRTPEEIERDERESGSGG